MLLKPVSFLKKAAGGATGGNLTVLDTQQVDSFPGGSVTQRDVTIDLGVSAPDTLILAIAHVSNGGTVTGVSVALDPAGINASPTASEVSPLIVASRRGAIIAVFDNPGISGSKVVRVTATGANSLYSVGVRAYSRTAYNGVRDSNSAAGTTPQAADLAGVVSGDVTLAVAVGQYAGGPYTHVTGGATTEDHNGTFTNGGADWVTAVNNSPSAGAQNIDGESDFGGEVAVATMALIE